MMEILKISGNGANGPRKAEVINQIPPGAQRNLSY